MTHNASKGDHSKNGLIPKHLLDIDTFSSQEFKSVFDSADQMLKILRSGNKKTDILRGKTIILLFQ